MNKQKRSGLQIAVIADCVAQCFFRYARTKEVRGSSPTEVVYPFFLINISTQQPGIKQNPIKNRPTA